jgi:hypothetical protein
MSRAFPFKERVCDIRHIIDTFEAIFRRDWFCLLLFEPCCLPTLSFCPANLEDEDRFQFHKQRHLY